MRFLRIKFRKTDIFMIPIVAVLMFVAQYYAITDVIKNQETKLKEKLDNMAKQCRNGDKKSCDDYIMLVERLSDKH